MKKSLILVSFLLCVVSIVAQSQYDYYDDDAVAGGAENALNGLVLMVLLAIGAFVLLLLGGLYYKIYYWFNPEKNPEYIARKRREEQEKAKSLKQSQSVNQTKSTVDSASNKNTYSIVQQPKKEEVVYSDEGYKAYKASFELTIKPESKDIMRDLYSYKMYEGDKLISAWHGAGTTNRDYDFNPKDGTRIICDSAYDDYDRRFERSIILPNSVVAIGNNAFMFNSLNKFTIPPSVKYITGNPFSNRCEEITCLSDRFSFENGCLLSNEQSLMIADLGKLEKIKETPQEIKYIGRGAYSLQKNLQLIKISPSVVAISDAVFLSTLRVVVFLGRTEIVEPTSFSDNVKAVYVPQGMKKHYMKILPEGLKAYVMEMDGKELSDKEMLTQLILSEDKAKYQLVNIPRCPRKRMLSEHKAYIESMKKEYSLTKRLKSDSKNRIIDWGESEGEEHEEWDEGDAYYSSDGRRFLRFNDNVSDYTVKDGVEVIVDYAFDGSSKKNIKLPTSVKAIGNNVFYDANLGIFEIPKSVEIITGNPFVYCNVELINHSPNFVYDRGVLYDKAKLRIISVLWDYGEKECFLDPNVIVVGRNAFYEGSVHDIDVLELPPQIKYIGESAFGHLIIQEVKLPNGIIEIAKSAFEWSYIKAVDLPSSLAKLGESAFAYCERLESVVLSSNLMVIEKNTFHNCKKLKVVYIPEGIKVLKEDCFSWCERLTEVCFPNSLTKIEKGAFTLCPLKTVVLSRQTTVEEGAFPSTCEILYREE